MENGKNSSMALEKLVLSFDEANISAVDIGLIIKNYSESYRTELYIIANSLNKHDLANKIRQAIILVEENEIAMFKEAVEQGYGREYLNSLTFEEKTSLMVNMDLLKIGVTDKRPLNNMEQKYYDLFTESINESVVSRNSNKK